MANFLKGLFCWLGLVSAFYAHAQELPEEQVEVVKDYEAQLAKANKISFSPVPPSSTGPLPSFNYNIAEKILPVTYKPPQIKPLSMKTEAAPVVYNGFLKAGFGYPLSPYFDAGYYSSNRDDNSFLIRASHHSAADNSVENLRFSDNDVKLEGRTVNDYGFAIEGLADFSMDNHFFYGYNRDDLSFQKEDVSNRLTNIGLGAKIYNVTENDKSLSYLVDAKGYRLTNQFETQETGLDLDLGLTKWFGNFPVEVTIGTDQTALKDTTGKRTLSIFQLGSSLTFGSNVFRAKIGARLGSSADQISFYPDVEFLLNLAANNLSLFAGAGGNLMKNTYQTFTDYNPFMVPVLSGLKNSSYYDFYAGLRGIISGIEFSAQAGFKPIRDLALFTVDQSQSWARFDALYDTTDIIYFKGSLEGQLFPGFTLSGNLVLNRFSANQQDKAWFLPQLQAKAGVSYVTLEDKLRVKADVFVRDAVPFIELELDDQPNALFDVSVGADFYFMDNIGLFVHLNNLAANRYRRWYNYPTFSLNILGGVTARF